MANSTGSVKYVLCTLRCLPRLPWMGSTGWPALSAATTLRWPGMIQKSTLALIAVASIAPMSRKAACPGKRWQASQAAMHTSTATSAPTISSPFFFWPKTRQMPSYSSQNTTRKARAEAMAAAEPMALGSAGLTR